MAEKDDSNQVTTISKEDVSINNTDTNEKNTDHIKNTINNDTDAVMRDVDNNVAEEEGETEAKTLTASDDNNTKGEDGSKKDKDNDDNTNDNIMMIDDQIKDDKDEGSKKNKQENEEAENNIDIDENFDGSEIGNDSKLPPTASTSVTTSSISSSIAASKKRGRGGTSAMAAPILDSVTASALVAASQYASQANLHGLSALLTSALTPSLSSSAASLKQLQLQLQQQQQQQDPSTSSSVVQSLIVPFIIPTIEMVQAMANKCCLEQPPWVHWSKADMAPQLKIVDNDARLQIQGAMRGYRMARASHGVTAPKKTMTTTHYDVTTTSSSGGVGASSTVAAGTTADGGTSSQNNNISCYYYEIIVLPGPSAHEIVRSLPPNARLGPGLRELLNKAIEWEDKNKRAKISTNNTDEEDKTNKNDNDSSLSSPPAKVGGHVRVGWSMRTGDLQAPVGYDKWSYGIRDQNGSIIHCSQRQDNWGGVDCSEPGTVIGCAIALENSPPPSTATTTAATTATAASIGNTNATTATTTGVIEDSIYESNNHIRFFKNGECMGKFITADIDSDTPNRVIGGGEAYTNIELGTYYPAVSCYMGGSIKANFGPYWIYPPKRNKLPSYMKQLSQQPVSMVCPPPLQPDKAVAQCTSTAKLFRKAEHQNAFKEGVRAEATIQYHAYQQFLKDHIKEIKNERQERGLSIQDLPSIEADINDVPASDKTD